MALGDGSFHIERRENKDVILKITDGRGGFLMFTLSEDETSELAKLLAPGIALGEMGSWTKFKCSVITATAGVCGKCGGKGTVEMPCAACQSSGHNPDGSPCGSCRGTGKILFVCPICQGKKSKE